MARRNDVPRIEIELLGDGVSPDAYEVDFGGRSGRRLSAIRQDDSDVGERNGDRPAASRRRPMIASGALAMAAVVIAVMSTRGVTSSFVTKSGSSPATLGRVFGAETDSLIDDLAPISEIEEVVESAPTDAVTTTVAGPVNVTGGLPVVDVAEPWGLYFSVGLDVYRLDLQTGGLTLFEEGSSAVMTVLNTAVGPVVLRPHQDFRYNTSPGPPGMYWSMSDGTASSPESMTAELHLIDAATDATVRTVPFPWTSNYAYLVGSTPDGLPVVVGPDQLTWIVRDDGSVSRLGSGYPVVLVPGGSVWSRCDDAGVCRRDIETPVGSLSLPASLNWPVTISPNGAKALLNGSDGNASQSPSLLVDLATGTTQEVGFPLPSVEGIQFGNQGSQGAWTPDARFFVAGEGDVLRILDTSTGLVSEVSLESAGIFGIQALAIF